MNLRTLGFAVALICAGCLTAQAQTPTPADAPSKPLKVLRFAFENAETGFDPVQISDLYSRRVTTEIFDAPLRFVYLAKAGTVEPNTLTEMPTMSADARTFTFKVKPGIYFADDPAFKGKKRELVAADYVYSLKRFADPRWNATFWSTIETQKLTGLNEAHEAAAKSGKFDYDAVVPGLRTIDKYTFQIKTDRPNPRLTDNFADSSIYGAVAREVVEFYGDDIMAHPVGTGPFRLVEWRRSSRMVFERNPNYREVIFDVVADPDDADAQRIAAAMKGKRLPIIDRVEVDVINEQQPRWLAFLNGSQDLLERMPLLLSPIALPNGKPSKTLRDRGIRVERVPLLDVTFQVFNMEDPVIGGYTPEKVALRRAISLSMDTAEMIRALYKGQGFVAQTPIAPLTTGYDPTVVTEMGITDPARANALLDAYGYDKFDSQGFRLQPNGAPLTIKFSTQPEQASRVIDEVVKKSFDRIHVRLDFDIAQWSEQLRQARTGTFQMWSLGTTASGPDGASIFSYAYGPAAGGENLSRFHNAEFDKLYDRVDEIVDGPERIALMREMTKIIIAYAPMNFMIHRYAIDMTYPWVLNYRRWPFAQADFWRYVDIDTDLQRKAGH
ncbi:ABC transporter substrate-binding protein [soil metagenome]